MRRAVVIADPDLAACVGGQQQMIDGRGNRRIGKGAQPPRGLARVEQAKQIGKCHEQREPALGNPEPCHDLVVRQRFVRLRRRPGMTRVVHEMGKDRLQRLLNRAGQQFDFDERDIAQIGRKREGREQDPAQGTGAGEQIAQNGMVLGACLEACRHGFQLGLRQGMQHILLHVAEPHCIDRHPLLQDATAGRTARRQDSVLRASQPGVTPKLLK